MKVQHRLVQDICTKQSGIPGMFQLPQSNSQPDDICGILSQINMLPYLKKQARGLFGIMAAMAKAHTLRACGVMLDLHLL